MAKNISTLFEIGFETDDQIPLYRQLYGALRDAILAGRLKPGDRLPASRALAQRLGCSRNRVTEAYEMLAAEGYLEGRIGAGSFVSYAFSESWVIDRIAPVGTGQKRSRPHLSRVGRILLAMDRDRQVPTPTPFSDAAGPDGTAFPYEAWARAIARAWRRPNAAEVRAGDPMGYHPLREFLADYLGKLRALNCTAEQVMITSGAQHALDLVARILLDPEEPVWIEDPSYRGARAALAAAGTKQVPVPVDAEGFDVRRASDIEPDARAAVVTPSHQFPLGVTMSLARRMQLLDWAQSEDRWIVEDDYDSEFRYHGRPIPALHGLDNSGRVIYLGTFSKAMFPGLRLGYLVLPDELIDAFVAARRLLDGHTGTVAQLAMADFVGSGEFATHLRRMRALYGRRGAIMLRQVQEKLAPYLSLPPGSGGMHVLIHLHDNIDDVAIARRAATEGVACQPLSGFHAGDTVRRGLVLGFGTAVEHAIEGQVVALKRVMDRTSPTVP